MPLKILLVDDEQDILLIMKKALNGQDVIGFTDPRAAFNAIKNNPEEYCILISDIRMPGMNGFELAREAKKLSENIKVILLTAFEVHLSELKRVLPSTNIDGVIQKPFRIAELQAIVSKMMTQFFAENNPNSDGMSNGRSPQE